MESVALQNFECLKKVSDPSFSIARTGVYLCEEHSFLAASPDAIATDSHGTAVVEVKCPKKYSTFLISDAAKNLDFALQYNEETEEYYLPKTHAYYHQVQLQMYVTGHHKCYFVVYTAVDLMYIDVPYDLALLNETIPLAKKYFLEVIMPEALAGYYYMKAPVDASSPNQPPHPYLPCYCKFVEPVIVTVVVCADENCLRKTFHLKCIRDQPNANPTGRITKKWKCDLCKKAATRKKANERQPLATVTNKQ